MSERVKDFPREGHMVVRVKDIQDFCKRHPNMESQVISAMSALTRSAALGAGYGGRETVDGIFVDENSLCFPWVVMMVSLSIEEKKNPEKPAEPTAEQKAEAKRAYDKIMADMGGKK